MNICDNSTALHTSALTPAWSHYSHDFSNCPHELTSLPLAQESRLRASFTPSSRSHSWMLPLDETWPDYSPLSSCVSQSPSLMAHGPQADNTRHLGVLFNHMLSSVTSAVNQKVPWLYVTLVLWTQASCRFSCSALIPCVVFIWLFWWVPKWSRISSLSFPIPVSQLQAWHHHCRYGDMLFCFHQHFCSYTALCPSENQAMQTPYPPQMATFNLLAMSALKCHFSWQSHTNLQRKIIDFRRIYLQERDFRLVPWMITILRTVLSM